MRKVTEITIPGRLPGLNEYTAACRGRFGQGNRMKRDAEKLVNTAILGTKRKKLRYPVFIRYTWVEKDRRRDLDNISSFGRKVIQDALVKAGYLENDGWKQICGFADRFAVDKQNPRIVIEIFETEEST